MIRQTPSHTSLAKFSTLALAVFFAAGCAAIGGSVAQNQSDETSSPENNAEQTSAERTSAEEPTTGAPDDASRNADGESDEAGSGNAEVRTENGNVVVRAGDAEVTAGPGGAVVRSGGEVVDSNASGGRASGGSSDNDARLRMTGERGTEFTGVCEVGGEPTNLDGTVPASFDFDLADGAGLSCEISKQGDGRLRVTFTAGDNRIIRESNTGNTSIEFDYENDSVTSVSSGSSSSSSTSSTSTSSTSSSSQTIVRQSSNVQGESRNSSSQSVSVTD